MYALLLLFALKSASSVCLCALVMQSSVYIVHMEHRKSSLLNAARCVSRGISLLDFALQHAHPNVHTHTLMLNAVHSCCHHLVLRLQLCMRQIVENSLNYSKH